MKPNDWTNVAGGISLVSFLIATIFYYLRMRHRERLITLKRARTADLPALLADAVAIYKLDTDKLTKEQRYDLAISEISHRGRRFLIGALLAAFVALLLAGMSIFALGKEPSAARVSTDDNVKLPPFLLASNTLNLPGKHDKKLIYIYNDNCLFCENIKRTMANLSVPRWLAEEVDFISMSQDQATDTFYGVKLEDVVPRFIFVDAKSNKLIQSSCVSSLDLAVHRVIGALRPQSQDFIIKSGTENSWVKFDGKGELREISSAYGSNIIIKQIFENHQLISMSFTNSKINDIRTIAMKYSNDGKTVQIKTEYGTTEKRLIKPEEEALLPELIDCHLVNNEVLSEENIYIKLADNLVYLDDRSENSHFFFDRATSQCKITLEDEDGRKNTTHCSADELPKMLAIWQKAELKVMKKHLWGINLQEVYNEGIKALASTRYTMKPL